MALPYFLSARACVYEHLISRALTSFFFFPPFPRQPPPAQLVSVSAGGRPDPRCWGCSAAPTRDAGDAWPLRPGMLGHPDPGCSATPTQDARPPRPGMLGHPDPGCWGCSATPTQDARPPRPGMLGHPDPGCWGRSAGPSRWESPGAAGEVLTPAGSRDGRGGGVRGEGGKEGGHKI